MYQLQKQRDFIKNELSQNPPFQCDFKVGDRVIFTNVNGVEFETRIIGFSDGSIRLNKAFIHLDGGAYWFPHLPTEIKHIKIY